MDYLKKKHCGLELGNFAVVFFILWCTHMLSCLVVVEEEGGYIQWFLDRMDEK